MTPPTHDQEMSGLLAELESNILFIGGMEARSRFLRYKKLACCAFVENQKPIVIDAINAVLSWDHYDGFLIYLDGVLKELTDKYPPPGRGQGSVRWEPHPST